MDLHAGQIQGFFRIPVDHMTGLPLFARYYRETLGLHGDGVVVVSPDPGRAKMATKFAQMLDADFALMNKQRPAHDVASVTEVVGDVRGKVAILSDDIIVTGGTLVAGAQALLDAGATKVYACATHWLVPDDAVAKLVDSQLAGVAVADTVPISELNRPDKLTVLTISGILAETIEHVFSDESVSAIFAGENQLF
jgi:ribose-phosphate pyrophosphokinase